jgi:hypothetical protein
MRTISLVSLLVGSLVTFHFSSQAQVSVIGELSQEFQAAPGQICEGSVIIRNDTDEPQEAKVYQTDYLFHHDGTNEYGEPGSNRRSNARWLSFSPSYVFLPPRSTMAVNYRVEVPADSADDTLRGTYWSMLMVEGIPKGSPESSVPTDPTKTQMGILQTIRYGIQVVTHIAGTGTRDIRFLHAELTEGEGGTKMLQVDIENTGEIGMRPDVAVELYNDQGELKGTFAGTKYRLYPGTSVRQSIELGKFPSGTYKALVLVDAGGDEVFAAQYSLKF